mmetsp:Transcript_28566/g.72783  ORF Transcript_28566/g.72783 Transcript_28566/m.72783 type:complete len:596 (-) Transcript_28566:669-2456(-)
MLGSAAPNYNVEQYFRTASHPEKPGVINNFCSSTCRLFENATLIRAVCAAFLSEHGLPKTERLKRRHALLRAFEEKARIDDISVGSASVLGGCDALPRVDVPYIDSMGPPGDKFISVYSLDCGLEKVSQNYSVQLGRSFPHLTSLPLLCSFKSEKASGRTPIYKLFKTLAVESQGKGATDDDIRLLIQNDIVLSASSGSQNEVQISPLPSYKGEDCRMCGGALKDQVALNTSSPNPAFQHSGRPSCPVYLVVELPVRSFLSEIEGAEKQEQSSPLPETGRFLIFLPHSTVPDYRREVVDLRVGQLGMLVGAAIGARNGVLGHPKRPVELDLPKVRVSDVSFYFGYENNHEYCNSCCNEIMLSFGDRRQKQCRGDKPRRSWVSNEWLVRTSVGIVASGKQLSQPFEWLRFFFYGGLIKRRIQDIRKEFEQDATKQGIAGVHEDTISAESESESPRPSKRKYSQSGSDDEKPLEALCAKRKKRGSDVIGGSLSTSTVLESTDAAILDELWHPGFFKKVQSAIGASTRFALVDKMASLQGNGMTKLDSSSAVMRIMPQRASGANLKSGSTAGVCRKLWSPRDMTILSKHHGSAFGSSK